MTLAQTQVLDVTPRSETQRKIEQHALQVERLLDYAKSYNVISNWSAEEAISIAGEAKKLHKLIETARKDITEPHRKVVNKVNDTAKVFTEKLKAVEDIIKQKVETWKRIIEEKNKATEEALKKMTDSMGSDVSLYVDNAPKYVRGDGAMSYETTQWKFDVEDLSIVPREFLTIDEEKVKLSVKMGTRTIPGLKIYSEQKTIIKSR